MKESFVIPILRELAQELGFVLEVEPRFGYAARVVLPDGRTRYLRNTVFDLNGAGSTDIAKDKDYASFFLAKSGYPVPEGESFHTREWAKKIASDRTPERAWEYAQRLGLPVIVKPNSKSQGAGVSLPRTKRDFFRAVARASQSERVFLVQRFVPGKDYRIVVLDSEVISAYERLPLAVTGDGRSTVLQLLEAKQREFDAMGRDTKLVLDDPRITETLHDGGRTRQSVLADGERIRLLPNANLSTGGDARDVTADLHPAWKTLAAQIARDMNLRYIGIDVITDTELLAPPGTYVVLEINAAPGLDNYAAMGETQVRIVRDLYRRVLLAMAA